MKRDWSRVIFSRGSGGLPGPGPAPLYCFRRTAGRRHLAPWRTLERQRDWHQWRQARARFAAAGSLVAAVAVGASLTPPRFFGAPDRRL